jgi:hypothetical protein
VANQISEGRQAVYYLGMILSAIGFLMFLTPFFAIAGCGAGSDSSGMTNCSMGGRPVPCSEMPMPPDMAGRVASPMFHPDPAAAFGSIGTAFAGFLLCIFGGVLMNLGRAGLAGSGVVLDPEGARQDLKPWNEARGRMIDDTLSQVEVVQHLAHRDEPETVVKVRCPQCHGLNDETQAFCGHCGAKL